MGRIIFSWPEGRKAFIISFIMKSIDSSEQWRSFKETYSRMSEDELQIVANDAYDLTEIAREALRAEISGRGLSSFPSCY